MSLSVFINEKFADHIGTTAWVQFGDWVDSLDLDDFPEIIHLWEHGWSQNLPVLAEQLKSARAASPPESQNAAAIAGQLVSLISNPKFDDDEEGVLVVSDEANDSEEDE